MATIQSQTSHVSYPALQGPRKKQHAPSVQEYTRLLNLAKTPKNAKTGEYTLGKNPLTGDITLGMKNVMGFYGIAFKPDGSVVQILAPANGGPQQVMPAGSFDFAALEKLLQEKESLSSQISGLQQGQTVPSELAALLQARDGVAKQLLELKAQAPASEGARLNVLV